jgi:1-acyl-sn-glycerol-3-phosphate acyltransferase
LTRRHTLTYKVVMSLMRGLIDLLCRVDDSQLDRVPQDGPLILIANHINFLEVPLVYAYLRPRPITGFAKAESWDNPLKAFLFDLVDGIPLDRGEADMNAFRQALAALEEGCILAIAPEGTRSYHGRLQRGLAGITLLALRSGAPIQPMVHCGGELFWKNLRRLRRTDVDLVVGNVFYLEASEARVTSQVRQQMIDEAMYQMAALLPPVYRGVYSDLEAATETYLRFPEGSQSNLPSAL